MTKRIYTSSVPRAHETGKEVAEEMNLQNKDKISVKVRSQLGFLNEDYYPKKIAEEFMYWKDQGLTEEELVADFLNGKRESQPQDLAKNYLLDMSEIFKRVISSGDSLKIIAFRHGEKDSQGNLTDYGHQQAKELGRVLDAQSETTDNTIYIATHNTINESILTTLFGRDGLPGERMLPLGFTEPVEYTFIPGSNGKGFLSISLRGKTMGLDVEEFNKVINHM